MKLTVGTKLGLGFGAILVLMSISTGLSYIKLNVIQANQDTTLKVRVPTMEAAREAQDALDYSGAKARQAILAGTQPERREAALKAFAGSWERVDKAMSELNQLAPHFALQENRDKVARLNENLPKARAAQEAAMNFAFSGAPDAVVRGGNEYVDKATPIVDMSTKSLAELVDSIEKLILENQASLEAANSSMRWTMGITTALALCVGVLVAALLGKKISSATGAALERAEAIAAGDLTGSDVDVTSQDEIGELTAAINKMQSSLKSVVESILSSTEHLASASEEISASATEQSAGMESQKDQTHQVATAMQEMSSTVVQISDNSTKAADAAKKASETAREGGKIVEETLSKMREIASSVGETAKKVNELGSRSDQIGQIIGVIDDIADQTNLLALNAAIEAARAGEQGRGFAVVADEVRKLAERTSKATKEIAQMIQAIQEETKSAVTAMEGGTKQVESGVEMTTQAGSSLHEIIQSAEQVGEMVTHIATAATEQSSATEEVNTNIEQIAKITAETAEGAQQSAKACHDLSNLALDLQNIVGQFKIGTNGGSHKPASRVKARPGGAHAFKAPTKAERELEEVGVN
ncbi:MAG TPA: methyl-accepting chemotaxis protein [Candidatus Sulfotelmatobacter sp.]|nr:methyl-accepting chemotaxis protein [Candidatus Sulfotelmatobacter sp.]